MVRGCVCAERHVHAHACLSSVATSWRVQQSLWRPPPAASQPLPCSPPATSALPVNRQRDLSPVTSVMCVLVLLCVCAAAAATTTNHISSSSRTPAPCRQGAAGRADRCQGEGAQAAAEAEGSRRPCNQGPPAAKARQNSRQQSTSNNNNRQSASSSRRQHSSCAPQAAQAAAPAALDRHCPSGDSSRAGESVSQTAEGLVAWLVGWQVGGAACSMCGGASCALIQAHTVGRLHA